jgi:hypothetical protein
MTLGEVLTGLFNAAEVDPAPFLARLTRQASWLGKPVGDVNSDVVIAFAERARRTLQEKLPTEATPELEDIVAELIGRDETRRRNVAISTTESAHSGLAAPLAGSHEHRFLSLTANVPGHLVAYWAILGTAALPYVSHQSIEFLCNMDSSAAIDFHYYRDAEWSALGEEPTSTRVEPLNFTIFDGRAPHRHQVRGSERAAALVVQFAQGPAFTDAVAFASVPPGTAGEGPEDISLSFGVEPQNVQFRELVGKRLRGLREAYGRTLDDVMRLVSFKQAARTGDAYTGNVSGSARVKLSRTESGMERLPFSWLLQLSDALDTPLRQVAMYPGDIIIQKPAVLPITQSTALTPSSYFFSAGPAAAFDMRIVDVEELTTEFRAVPGECLIVPFNCSISLDLVLAPARFRMRNKSLSHAGVNWWDHADIQPDDVASRTAEPCEIIDEADAARRALYFRGELPHRVHTADKNGTLLVIGHRSIVAALTGRRT